MLVYDKNVTTHSFYQVMEFEFLENTFATPSFVPKKSSHAPAMEGTAASFKSLILVQYHKHALQRCRNG